MKYRPSKSFVFLMLPLTALVVSFGFGLLPNLKDIEAHPIPGEITFKHSKPRESRAMTVSMDQGASSVSAMDWFEDAYENVMKWEYNPWKRRPDGFGDHFFKLIESKDPLDQAKCRELWRLADGWHQKLLLRYPELAVTMKSIPDDQNGFLKWLDLRDKIKASNPDSSENIVFPKELGDYFSQQGAWNAELAEAWLTQNQSLVDEIHAIGLLPEQSVNGIPIERWGFLSARFAKSCEEIMILEARVATEQGDAAAALESVRAAKGLVDHFGEIESPSLLATTVNILLKLSLERHVLNDIIPALPVDQIDPAIWENALNPKVSSPAEFGRIMKGEWSTSSQYLLLPMLLDADDPKCPTDGGELLDHYSMSFVETVRLHETAKMSELPGIGVLPMADSSHLSRSSRQAADTFGIGAKAWRKGWERTQSQSAMTQAAFAIMKGQAIPKDPIHGTEYRWDPATRQLSMPASEVFDEMQIKPITVPKL